MLSKALDWAGRVFITAGALILLFVAYQLWGTGLQEAQAQKQLAKQFEQSLSELNRATTTTQPDATTTTGIVTAPANLPLPAYGDPIARLRIPKIGVDKTVVEGVGLDQLKRGAGHYPETPLPGQAGNVGIAGHRTTYGAPFHNIDKLVPGDPITVTTLQGTFTYKVIGTQIVAPTDVHVLDDQGDNRLTLTACHPKYSARQRIIVSAVLVGTPQPQLVGQEEARRRAATQDGPDNSAVIQIDGGLSGTESSRTPAILWGLECALIWMLAWSISRLIRRHSDQTVRRNRMLARLPYAIGLPLFLASLYVFFENFARLLPGNF